MSEHYDFHYQPTGSGAISGQQVLEQTEDAINELGEYVNDNVGGAMDVAQQALETAQNAEQDAQTALDTANSFSSAIQSAQQDASTALSTAQTAQTTASNASNTANQASQDASSAVTTANNASGQVSTLSGTVTALGQRVTTAEGNIGQNTSDITALTTRVGTAEGNITTLQNDVTIAQGNASSAMATAGTVKQQAYVFRYSSTALTPSSTNSNTLLDNTDNLKVGDKVIDSDGVLFSITAIDTANSTFTVGSALIDLALDANVVHTSGDETINGVKSFINYFLGKNLSGQTVDLNDCVDAYGGAIHYYYAVSNYTNISNKPENKPFILESKTVRYVSSMDYIYYQKIYTADYNASPSIYTRYYRSGSASWSNWVKDTDKFVTTDTNQTISGQKLFDDINTMSSASEIGVSGGNNSFKILDKNKKTISRLEGGTFSGGMAYSYLLVNNGSDVFNGVTLYQPSANLAQLRPYNSTLSMQLGASNRYFSDCYTSKINGVEPSSLSLPVAPSSTSFIDISSYITDMTGGVANNFTPPANGYITFSATGTQAQIFSDYGLQSKFSIQSGSTIRGYHPVLKNEAIKIYILASSLDFFRFIPCQGNV